LVISGGADGLDEGPDVGGDLGDEIGLGGVGGDAIDNSGADHDGVGV
jgi:hypothetical protein